MSNSDESRYLDEASFYKDATSNAGLTNYPPHDQWHDWTELDAKAWPGRVERHFRLIPTTCFNCEAACGLVAYVDRETGEVAKFEGNPEHPASRGRKRPANRSRRD